MPNAFKLDFAFPVPCQELFQKLALTKAVGLLKVELVQPEQTRMLFINPSTWAKRGQNVLVILKQNGPGGTIGLIQSSCISGLKIFDGGQNQKNCEVLRDHIAGLVKELGSK